jgi:membrane fusion protein (multidrug efflux system)
MALGNRHFFRIGLLLLLILILGGGGLAYWLYIRAYVSTDDAYVAGHQGVISPRVPGRVLQVLVEDNQSVREGQLLISLDPRDYEVAVAEAVAALDRLRQEVDQRYVAVKAAQARVAQTKAVFHKAETDRERYQNLFARRTVSRETLDRVVTDYKVSQAERDRAAQEHRQALAAIGGSANIPPEEQPALKEAQARVEQARLNLQYAKITAPFAGYITRKQVEPGNWVTPGRPLMLLIPLTYPQVWIEANFKETQITEVRIGQPAAVKVDTYPDITFQGRVDSLMSGTGAAFSLLPPENATGNWVKVVQRVPVKVVLEPPFPENHPLRLGMSTIVTIDTRDRTGLRLLSPIR